MSRGGMTKRRVKLVLFALLALALGLGAVAIFANVRLWSHRDHYVIHYGHSVTGLTQGARVELWGVPVGSVESVALEPGKSSPIAVRVTVDAGTKIPTDARAKLSIEGVTGVKYIDIVDGEMTGPFLKPGADIQPDEHDLGQALDQAIVIVSRLGKVVTKIDHVADNLAALTDAHNRTRVASFLEDLDRAASATAGAASDVRALSREMRERGQPILSSLESASADLHGAAQSARGAMDEAERAARNVSGTAAKADELVTTGGREVQSALFQVRSAAQAARDLMRLLEENPARLLRSSTLPEREPP